MEPILHWNDLRLLQALEVAPIQSEIEDAEIYRVARGGLGLTVISHPYLSALDISLRTEPGREPITSFVIRIHGTVEYISDKSGQFLQCDGCFLTADLYAAAVDASAMHLAFTMKIFIKPRIEIRFA